jgi:hypothetical protein
MDLYLKDESVHPTGSLKHRLARSLFLYGVCNGWIQCRSVPAMLPVPGMRLDDSVRYSISPRPAATGAWRRLNHSCASVAPLQPREWWGHLRPPSGHPTYRENV